MTLRSWAARAYRRLANPVNRRMLGGRDRRRLEALLRRLRDSSGWDACRPPVFVIVLPNTLGWVEPCVKLVPPEVPLLLLGNGLSRAELRRLTAAAPGRPVFRLSVLPGSFCKHGTVLDLLLAAAGGDFILLDHDCYVFEATLFESIAWEPEEFLAGIDRQGFVMVNEASGLRFPRTHFLVIRRDALLELGARYGVGCEKRTRTPRRAVEMLARIGLGDDNFPPAHLPFYDTLQLLMALAFAEGRTVRWLPVAGDGISHVGGTARLRNLPGRRPGPPAEPAADRTPRHAVVASPSDRHIELLRGP